MYALRKPPAVPPSGNADQIRLSDHRPPPLRRIFGGERDETRRGAAETDTGCEAYGEQLVVRRCLRGQQREDAEDHRRRDQAALTAETVAKRAERQRADRGAKKRRREDRTERPAGEPEFVSDQRRGDGDRLAVDAVEKRHEGTENDRENLEGGERGLVDHPGKVDSLRGLRAHAVFLTPFSPATAAAGDCAPHMTATMRSASSSPAPRQATY